MRANWFLDVVVDDGSDPFAQDDVDVEAAGERIDLRAPDLEGQIAQLLELEALMYREGYRCPVKDRADTCCSACPIRGTGRVTSIERLCRLGVKQERMLTSLAVSRVSA